MSLILEALKKSEDKRRLGAAPDLATPFSAPRRRNWIWPIAALIIVAGVVAWALRPSSPPPPTPVATVPPKTKTTIAQTAPAPGQKTGAPLRSVTGNNDLVQTAPPDNIAKAEPESKAGTSGQFVFGQPNGNAPATNASDTRAAVEAARERRRAAQANRAAGATTPATMPPPNVVAGAAAPKTNAVTPVPTVVAPKTNATAQTPPAAPIAPLPQRAATPMPSPATAAAPAASTTERAPKSSATVGLTPAPAASAQKTTPAESGASAQPYSELPFSVRKSLPELKLSMHVFAADPTHRFVVINDSRLTEGEKTSDDIFVREIRPDGVVLEFQSQRFFFPRDGL